MGTVERIKKAVESYDHLLWQAIINVGGFAESKSFEQKGNAVRIVYKTSDPDNPRGAICFNPRDLFEEISTEVKRLISSNLPIRKTGGGCRSLNESLHELCTNESYGLFLLEKISLEEGLRWVTGDVPVYCDFVEIGRKGTKDYICCPCVGRHLNSTLELEEFSVDLSFPKRVGKDTYEFRFAIKAK